MDDQRLQQALGYRRFTATPRILLLETGYHVEADVAEAAEELGWTLARLRTPTGGSGEGRFVAELLEALVVARPDFVLTMNQLGFDEDGELAALLSRYGVPLASWFVDHPLLILPNPQRQATPHCQLFCIERTALPWLRAQGFESPEHLQTASNGRRFHAARIDRAKAAELGAPLVFVGHSWWSKARTEPAAEHQARAATLGWPEPLARDDVGETLAARVAGIDAPDASSRMWAARVRIAESSLVSRGRFARALTPLGLRVHGDAGWRELAPAAELCREVDPARELPALFAGSAVNLNLTSDQLATAVNQRVWDVPGAGGFLLTDAQEDGLAAFREGEELAVFRGAEEAVALARFYLERPRERAAIVQRARRVVELGHRYTHRLRYLYEVMRRRFE